MAAPKGNKYGIGNRGGGRKSVAVEFAAAKWLADLFKNETDVEALEAKLLKKKYSVAEVTALKMLKGNDRLLNTTIQKLIPDNVNVNQTGTMTVNIVNYAADNDTSPVHAKKSPAPVPPSP